MAGPNTIQNMSCETLEKKKPYDINTIRHELDLTVCLKEATIKWFTPY